MKHRFDHIKPAISYGEFKDSHPDRSGDWCHFWDKYYATQYEKVYWEIINKNSTLKYLINEIFQKLDFQKIAKYMEDHDWKWTDHPFSPTIEQLKMGILGLIIDAVDDDGNMIRSIDGGGGGFEVVVKSSKNLPIFIHVIFRDDVIIEEKESGIGKLRKIKLVILNNLNDSTQ